MDIRTASGPTNAVEVWRELQRRFMVNLEGRISTPDMVALRGAMLVEFVHTVSRRSWGDREHILAYYLRIVNIRLIELLQWRTTKQVASNGGTMCDGIRAKLYDTHLLIDLDEDEAVGGFIQW